ncbi:hypothetical protein CMV_020442 [Castanea mollissima]|uniref:K Homology domain-containing protein n=1 Tax=Castanea mollissima TaxID=60419 RepID=A0A8J4VMP3_9ROSI|nr:hypothetical protein CMV_020442 [Castanea mollissima]
MNILNWALLYCLKFSHLTVSLLLILELAQKFPCLLFADSLDVSVSFASQTAQYHGLQGTSKRISIPNGKVGVIIGKGGETIKYLQLQSGAKIQITKDAEADPYSLTRDVELMGTSEQISRAEQLIKDVIAETDTGASAPSPNQGLNIMQPGAEQFSMKVPNTKVALLIGKGGETIRTMQSKSGARIQVWLSSSNVATLGLGVIQVLATGITTWLVDKAGRKLLLIISSTGMTLSLLLVAIAFYLEDTGGMGFIQAGGMGFIVPSQCSQDFEKAGELRDREMDLKAQISAVVDKGKEMSKAETEAGDVGPLVTELDIQHIVSSWTGIPVEKVSTDESDRLLKMEETLHLRVGKCKQPRPRQPPRACCQGQGPCSHGRAAKAKVAPMGTLPRPRHAQGQGSQALGSPHVHAAAKAKACTWRAAEAKAAPMGMLPRPRQGMQPRPRQPPRACCQGQGPRSQGQGSHGRAAKAKVAPMGTLPRPRQPGSRQPPCACSSQGQGMHMACSRGQGSPHGRAAKAKAGHAAKAKAAPTGVLPRPRHGHAAAKAKARSSQGLGIQSIPYQKFVFLPPCNCKPDPEHITWEMYTNIN